MNINLSIQHYLSNLQLSSKHVICIETVELAFFPFIKLSPTPSSNFIPNTYPRGRIRFEVFTSRPFESSKVESIGRREQIESNCCLKSRQTCSELITVNLQHVQWLPTQKIIRTDKKYS